MYQRIFLNRKWTFSEEFTGSMLIEPMQDGEAVDIPHTMCVTPYNYYDDNICRKEGVYQRIFYAPPEWKGSYMYLNFDGVAHFCEVYVNGIRMIVHACGYTSFKAEISNKVVFGSQNIITVKVDSRSGLNQPPFVIDDKMMAEYGGRDLPVDEPSFGGIYRDVYIDLKHPINMEDVFYIPATTLSPDTTSMSHSRLQSYAIPGRIESYITLSLEAKRMAQNHRLSVKQYLNDHEISSQPLGEDGKTITLTGPVKIWDIDSPNCYNIRTDLLLDDEVVDTFVAMAGFRDIKFKNNGFYLNGRKVVLRGICRNQVFPYVGFAMPESIQRQDARIIKEELFANAVRTTHCPPSKYFLEECDKLGILVFVDAPGWRNVGNDEWKQHFLDDVRDMIVEHRNHPSVIIWGTRPSGAGVTDVDRMANDLAHKLDPTRYTGGERLDKNMSIPEDIYTYSDYSFSDEHSAIETKEEISSDMDKPYIISGYLGQSYTVKSTDSSDRLAGHVIRVAKILDAVAESDDICGSFAYCMCDYNTQAEFSGEDGIAYQGFLDSFRNHKPVTDVMSSQNLHSNVLSITSSLRSEQERWDGFGKVFLMTNCDSVLMYREGKFIKEYTKDDTPFSNIRFGPILIDDYIGDSLDSSVDFAKDQIKRIKRMLNDMATHGLSAIYSKSGAVMDMLMTRFVYRMSKEELLELYDQHISTKHTWRLDGIKDSKVVKSIILAPGKNIYIRTDISNANLIERRGYDVVAVRVRVTDENSLLLKDYAESLSVRVEGPVQIVGSSLIPFRGGMCGVYIRSIGIEDSASVYLSCPGANTIRLTLSILKATEPDI